MAWLPYHLPTNPDCYAGASRRLLLLGDLETETHCANLWQGGFFGKAFAAYVGYVKRNAINIYRERQRPPVLKHQQLLQFLGIGKREVLVKMRKENGCSVRFGRAVFYLYR